MIVISGITSAIGINLALYLVKEGYSVKGFARRIDKAPSCLIHPKIELLSADLGDLASLKSICIGADYVVHLAALSSPWGKYEDFYSVNVEGTRSLITASEKANLKRFIHISTPSIYFDHRDRLDIAEDDPLPKAFVNHYAATKMLAEAAVFASSCPSIVLRPRAIFGPYDQTLLPRLLKVCKKRGLPTFSKRSPLVDITYVENLSQAILLAINAKKECEGKAYNITNGQPRPLCDLVDHLLKQLSIEQKHRFVPYPLAKGVAVMLEALGHMTGKEPPLTRYGLGVLKHSQTLSIAKARQELNYHPKIDINEGLDRYAHWLQTQ